MKYFVIVDSKYNLFSTEVFDSVADAMVVVVTSDEPKKWDVIPLNELMTQSIDNYMKILQNLAREI